MISVRFDVTGIELSVDGDEQQSRVDVDLDITACVDAYLQRDIPCVTDGFSTKYESELAFKEVKTELLAMLLDETLVSKQQTELDGFQTVSDLWASIQGLTVRPEQDQLNFEGELNLMVIGMDEEGMPAIADKTIPIDFQLPGTVPCGSVVAILNAEISNIQYTYQQGQLDLEADIKLGGQILCENRVGLVSDFVIKEDQPKQNTNRAALTIYYADPGEQVWDIAKRYNTSVDAIIEHNGLDGDALEAKQMLLVPIVE